ncbi:MAG: helix-turn-helix domain-containing protein [Egibacteraceae bacterium]
MEQHGTTIGERIAYYRQQRGLTQEVCANQVGRSESWLSQVERGVIQLDAAVALIRLATVLKVDLSKLAGSGADLPPNGGGHRDGPRGMPALVPVLLCPDTFTHIAAKRPMSLDALAERVERARRTRWAGRYTELALVLPDLIASARLAAQEGLDPRRAWGLLAHCYLLAEMLLEQLSEYHLRCLAADRAVAAADRADDELLRGLSAWRLGYALRAHGSLDVADKVAQDAASLLEAGLDRAQPEHVAVFGALRISTSHQAVATDDVATMREALREAARVAQLLPDGYVDPWTAFCPANVGFNEIAAWANAGDPVEALRVADRTDFDALPVPHRQAWTWVRVAYAHSLRRKDAAAVAALLEAERISPGSVRYRHEIHDLMSVLLGRERKAATPGLRGLARRIGIA